MSEVDEFHNPWSGLPDEISDLFPDGEFFKKIEIRIDQALCVKAETFSKGHKADVFSKKIEVSQSFLETICDKFDLGDITESITFIIEVDEPSRVEKVQYLKKDEFKTLAEIIALKGTHSANNCP